ncbi:MAG: FAD-dependent monooxygenase [Thermoanaerobaculia bacterium]|nr:FAD-dependent monooxygenase [Thermoanaerobaculia bacterium]
MIRETEVLILGGGPAGLAAAVATARSGLQVELLERFHPPIDKPCGEGLLPSGVAALARLGVDGSSLRGRELRGIRYLDAGVVAEGRFAAGRGRGVRRLELHRALAERAEAAGALLCWGVVVEGLAPRGRGRWVAETSEGPVSARWVIGADGLSSHVRRWAELDGPATRWRRFGVRRHYRIAPWSDLVEVYWAPGCEAYVTPVDEEMVGVAMLWSGSREGFDAHLARFPQLEARLAGAEVLSRDRGCGPFHQRTLRVARGSLALVGDASGYVDAITGEGLGLAFRQAEAVAEALRERDLGLYERRHRTINRTPELMTRLTLLLARHPALRRRAIRAMADDPRLFSRLLRVLDGDGRLVSTGVPALLRLGARCVVPS